MAKFAKLVWLAAVQLFYFCLSFFFHLIQTKKKRRERSKSNFWKGMTKTNVCCNAVPETQPPSSIDQAQGVFLQVDAAVLHLHNHSSCMPVASSGKSHNTPSIAQAPICDEARLLPVLLPTIRWTKKNCKNAWIMNYKKHNMDTKTCFPHYSKFHAKERSSDRSPFWRSLQIFCMKLRIKEKRLCVCVVCFKMLWELVHIEHSFWKGEHTFLSDWLWTTCIWHGCLFSLPFLSFLLLLLSNIL